jgi:hypothetical protein
VTRTNLVEGRRLGGRAIGDLVMQHNPEQLVSKHGHWTVKSEDEVFKENDVAQTLVRRLFIFGNVSSTDFANHRQHWKVSVRCNKPK